MGSSIKLDEVGIKLSHDDATFERQNVADLLGRQTVNFPGAQPVSFARRHLDELQRVDYYMCEKTDGIRCLLFLTHYISPQGLAVESQHLIDRKNDYYHIAQGFLHIPRTADDVGSFHTGTLLDGELVLDRQADGSTRLAYYIFDILALDAGSVTDRAFNTRWGKVQTFIWEPYRAFAAHWPGEVDLQPFALKVKKMEMPYGAMMMFKDVMSNLPHGNDGLIFTCVGTPYVSGTDQHILKWKPPEENTVDFRLVVGDFPPEEDEQGTYEDFDAKPELELHVNHGGGQGYKYFASLSLTDAEWDSMKRLNQQLDGRILECYRAPLSGHWRPKIEHETGFPRFRDDKTDANHISVVTAVLESIKDAVTEQDLIEYAPKIRAAFKERAALGEAKRRREKEKEAEAMKMAQQQRRATEGKPTEPVVDDGPTYAD